MCVLYMSDEFSQSGESDATAVEFAGIHQKYSHFWPSIVSISVLRINLLIINHIISQSIKSHFRQSLSYSQQLRNKWVKPLANTLYYINIYGKDIHQK